MNIQFFGAAGEVTGSCYLISDDVGNSILVDGGVFQGQDEDIKNQKIPEIDFDKLSAIFITHGHLDHCGRIPQYVNLGAKCHIYGTKPTLQLAQILWEDSAHLMANGEADNPLYNIADVEKAVLQLKSIHLRQKYSIGSFEIELFNTGHIIGSSGVIIRSGDQTLVISSDLGNEPEFLLPGKDTPASADTLVLESTYGNKTHQPKETCRTQLKDALLNIIRNKATLLIPAFAIERSQELLYDLDFLIEEEGIKPVNAYLDSPMAIRVTEVFKQNINFLNDEVNKQIKSGDDPFSFSKLKVTATSEQSKMINTVQGSKIVIAGSGMMDGGRVQHHLKRVLPNPKNIILIVGFQVPGTLGHEIESRIEKVLIDGRSVPVRAQTLKIEAYSAHADMPQMINWVRSFATMPKNILLVHGEKSVMDEFNKTLSGEFPGSVIACARLQETYQT